MRVTIRNLIFIVVAITTTVVAATSTKIHSQLQSILKSKNVADILISFDEGNTGPIQATQHKVFSGRAERITFLKGGLQTHASVSQQYVSNVLKSRGVPFKSFWISNQIYVKGATQDLVEALAKFPEIRKIIEDPKISLEPVERLSGKGSSIFTRNEEPVWSLKRIDVESAWKYGNGSGVLVGHIDSGVLHTHNALKDSFIGEQYGWYDPVLGIEIPYDEQGHGTHTMGTIVGTNGIGGAPGAKWMTCQACPTASTCQLSSFVECAQWILCPTRPNGTDPDCSKAPTVVSNSWGGPTLPEEDYFDNIAAAWHAGGIIGVFAIGNDGMKGCNTTDYPGRQDYAISVGATNILDEIAFFSSLGPAPDGRVKPDLSAPGENITSSLPGGNDEYGVGSGTSMATPLTASTVVLMLSVNPNMTFTEIKSVLLSSGVDTEALVAHNATCGGTDDDKFPNNFFGHGRINAAKAVLAALSLK